MANSIEEALKKAVQKVDSTEIVEGEGAEPSQELSARVKRLMARKLTFKENAGKNYHLHLDEKETFPRRTLEDLSKVSTFK